MGDDAVIDKLRAAAGFVVEHPPEELPPVEDIIARREVDFKRKKKAHDAGLLIRVNVTMDGPVGICHFGDPHVDDDGCDWPALRQHVDTVKRTPGMLAGNVGDLQNNWIGRLARLYGEQGTSARESWAMAEWLMRSVPWLYLVLGNHDCLDDETEALTRRGWMRFDDIAEDDVVLSRGPDGEAVWSPIEATISRPHDGPMVRIESRSVDLCATPNHRVLRQRRRWDKSWTDWELAPASDLPVRMALPVSGSTKTEAPLSDAQIELAGWILTDGGISKPGARSTQVSIWQSKPVEPITRLLDALGLKYAIHTRHRDIKEVAGRALVKPCKPQNAINLTADASRSVMVWLPAKGALPAWAMDLSDRQFGVLLDGLVGGDGCWENEGKTVAVIHGAKQFLDSVQAAAVAHGWRAFISMAREKDYRLNLCRTDRWTAQRSVVASEEHYTGRVWCLTVPLGNFMVRRNGKAHFTGNCWSGPGDPVKWIMRDGAGVTKPHGARLDLVFPNGKHVRVNARHDFRGHSMWNPAHGPAKAAQQGWRDQILTCGHLHISGYNVLKCPATGLISHALRVAGYKVIDSYADAGGLPNQNINPACVTIIDPTRDDADPGLVTVFWHVEEAAEFLTWKRTRGSVSRPTPKARKR